MGLAGLGDLVLTSTRPTISRGIVDWVSHWGVVKPCSPPRAASTRSWRACSPRVPCAPLPDRLAVEMPICREIFRIMHEHKPVREAAAELMGRELRSETE